MCYTRAAPATIFVLASFCFSLLRLEKHFIHSWHQTESRAANGVIPEEGDEKRRKIFTGDFLDDSVG